MLTYLAQPIDRGDGNPSQQAQDTMLELRKCGYNGGFFSPAPAFDFAGTPVHESIHAVVDINRHALEQCSAMLLVYRPGVESWGCPQELLFAWSSMIPVVVLLPKGHDGKLPTYLSAWVKSENLAVSPSKAATRLNEIFTRDLIERVSHA